MKIHLLGTMVTVPEEVKMESVYYAISSAYFLEICCAWDEVGENKDTDIL